MTNRILIIAFLFITRIAPAQTTAWIRQLNEEHNFLTAGSSRYYTVSKDAYAGTTYTVRQYNTDGTALLATTIQPGSPYTSMTVVKILATPNNALYILAYGNYGSTRTGLLFRLSTSLLQTWVRPLPSGINYQQPTPIDMAVKGNTIVVLMKSLTTAGNNSYELRAVNQSTGNITIGGQSGTIFSYLTPVSLAVDASQNVFVCGEITTNNAILIKHNTSLVQQWTKTFTTGGRTWFSSIATDVSGNVYVSGAGFNTTASRYRTIVRKYNSAGALQSSYSSGNLPQGNYWPTVGPKMIITAGGDVYVGQSSNGVVQPRIMAYKFSSANISTPVYAVTHLLPLTNWNFTMTGFEATQSGKLFFSGNNAGTSNLTNNYVTAKVRTDGTLEFTEVFNGGRCNALIKAIPGTYPNDEFVTTGVISNINMLIKYTGPGARMEETASDAAPILLKAYPNPALTTVNVEYAGAPATLQLIDLQGRRMLTQEITDMVTLDIAAYPRGLYLLRIVEENGRTVTEKIIFE